MHLLSQSLSASGVKPQEESNMLRNSLEILDVHGLLAIGSCHYVDTLCPSSSAGAKSLPQPDPVPFKSFGVLRIWRTGDPGEGSE